MPYDCIVIGGGWAGISAAVKEERLGAKVLLLESAPQLGGRARRINYKDHHLDNGQHLLIGAYEELLKLVKVLGADPEQLFHRYDFDLKVLTKSKKLELKLASLPSPVNLLLAPLSSSGLNSYDYYQLLKFIFFIKFKNFAGTVDELLAHCGQQPKLAELLWRPLCLAALSTPAAQADAQIFINVLRQTLKSRQNAQFLIPKADLSSILVHPFLRYAKNHDITIKTNHRVNQIQLNDNGINLVATKNAQFNAAKLIIAAALPQAQKLLATVPAMAKLVSVMQQFNFNPISTCYVFTKAALPLAAPFIGTDHPLVQWLFDRKLCGNQHCYAAAITGPITPDQKTTLQQPEFWQQFCQDYLKTEVEVVDIKLITEKQACFIADPQSSKLRQQLVTGSDSLVLAGDYLAGPYPATLETAVRS